MDEKEETDKLMDEARFVMQLANQVRELSISHEVLLKVHKVLANQVKELSISHEVLLKALDELNGRVGTKEKAEARQANWQADGRTEVIVNTYDRVLALEAEVERLTETVAEMQLAKTIKDGHE